MTVKTYKVTSPVSIVTRRFSRTFERGETEVTETEVEMVIAHIRACLEENVPAPTEAGHPEEH